MSIHLRSFLLACILVSLVQAATPNLQTNIERPLRYRPDGNDFVIVNGPDSFNRPLYGGNTAFRVDAGDRPEFSLFIPGRGGNLRIGIKTPSGTKWLREAAQITARYHLGSMIYDVRDPLLAEGTVRITALATYVTDGLVVRVEPQNLPAQSELVWAFGGANGDRGSRDGDIGTDRLTVTQFFTLKPEFCRDNRFEITGDHFTMQSKPARVAGVMPAGAQLAIADAADWNAPEKLFGAPAAEPAPAAAQSATPILIGHVAVNPNSQPLYLAIQRIAADANQAGAGQQELQAYQVSEFQAAAATQPQRVQLLPQMNVQDLPKVFADTQAHFERIARHIEVDTPDPYINAATAALCVAADAVWDEPQQAFMHGAVAWRSRLLGWRGAYSGDALGWPQRTVNHLANWFSKQDTSPVSAQKQGADADSDLARSEAMLHSNGDLTKSHYDMNLVAIDAMFRHLLWTGDVEYARSVWPVLQRHLAWEQRLFRRTFGPEQLPLYEAYACIWASDDVQYGGGGVTHSTAYNYYHNLMAARVAQMIGEDPKPYQTEAALILKAMRTLLWLPQQGWYGEYKDYLGNQLVHPSAAVWTHYHTIDSEVANPFEAFQMTRYIDTEIPHIPLKGPGVPEGFSQISTTSWMPYTWSVNNVVMAETVHTSLADWQAGRPNAAFALFKGAVLDSMFMGQCPGNVGMTTQFDDYRRESQRDFADAVGITSRAVVEGLFGVRPDAISGELTIEPGFPAEWDHASIKHPSISFSYKKEAATETFIVEPKFGKPMRLRLICPLEHAQIGAVTVNGAPAKSKFIETAVGLPRIEIDAPAADRWEVRISSQGEPLLARASAPLVVAKGANFAVSVKPAKLIEIFDPQGVLGQITKNPDGTGFTADATGAIGHRSAFAKVQQGPSQAISWLPVDFEIRPAYEIISTPQQDQGHLKFVIRNNTADPIDQDVNMVSGSFKATFGVKVPAMGESWTLDVNGKELIPGTNHLRIELGNGKTIDGDVTNWRTNVASEVKLEPVDLSAKLNDKVTQIFKNRYLSPRSPFCSLSIPTDGLGGWCTFNMTAAIDDTGLRAAAGKNDGRFILPQGIPFITPGGADAKNIAFVSQWDNYPRQIEVPLSGSASHAYFLMAGSSNNMQSRFDNGQVVVTYSDGTTQRLPLTNPTTWWPIERDYFVDEYAFARPEPVPPRVDLKTGEVRVRDTTQIKGVREQIPGGAATVLDLPLDPTKQLRSVTVGATANEVVIGLMGVTLVR